MRTYGECAFAHAAGVRSWVGSLGRALREVWVQSPSSEQRLGLQDRVGSGSGAGGQAKAMPTSW